MRARLLQFARHAALASACIAPLALCAQTPLALRTQVTATTPVVTLAELASEPLPPAWQANAGLAIVSAPAPGTRRLWERSEISEALAAAGVPAAEVAIPDQILLLRASHRLTRPQAWAAVALWLAAHPIYTPASDAEERMAMGDIEAEAPRPAISIDRARWDNLRSSLDLICHLSDEPALLPFTISVPLTTAAAGAAMARQAEQPPQWLVRPGQAVAMSLQTDSYSLDGTAMPLKPGALGDRIPVVNLLNQSVLQAVVTGKDAVRILAEDPFHDRP